MGCSQLFTTLSRDKEKNRNPSKFKAVSPLNFGANFEQILLCRSGIKFYMKSILQIRKSAELWHVSATARYSFIGILIGWITSIHHEFDQNPKQVCELVIISLFEL